jgi:hypothetical protein
VYFNLPRHFQESVQSLLASKKVLIKVFDQYLSLLSLYTTVRNDQASESDYVCDHQIQRGDNQFFDVLSIPRACFKTRSRMRTRSFDPDDENSGPSDWTFRYVLGLALADAVRIASHPLALYYHVSRQSGENWKMLAYV